VAVASLALMASSRAWPLAPPSPTTGLTLMVREEVVVAAVDCWLPSEN